MNHRKMISGKTEEGSLLSAEEKERLGLDRPITRRDFINGMMVGAGCLMIPGCTGVLSGSNTQINVPIPPPVPDYFHFKGDGGNSGNTIFDGHRLRNSYSFGVPTDTGEMYDLVVVGGGLGGLTAAYFYNRDAKGDKNVLILDNHPNFGGDSQRNALTVVGKNETKHIMAERGIGRDT